VDLTIGVWDVLMTFGLFQTLTNLTLTEVTKLTMLVMPTILNHVKHRVIFQLTIEVDTRTTSLEFHSIC
jgi:hypothetical protein